MEMMTFVCLRSQGETRLFFSAIRTVVMGGEAALTTGGDLKEQLVHP